MAREGRRVDGEKCHETETQLGAATRKTAVNLQVREDRHVTRDETLQTFLNRPGESGDRPQDFPELSDRSGELIAGAAAALEPAVG